MPSKTWYYQVGGFQAHLRLGEIPDEYPLRTPGSPGLSLILGILPNGASYLLLPDSRFRQMPSRGPHPPERFVSLSPIYFASRSELEKKLKNYASTKSNKNIPKDEIRDRSKANTSFTVTGRGLSDVGKARACFEHQRVLVLNRALRAELGSTEIAELSLAEPPDELRVISFCYNTWKADTRTLRVREADPKVLDCGWTEWSKPSQWNRDELAPSTTTHIIIKEERYLNNPGLKRLDCEYAEPSSKPRAEVAWELSKATAGGSPVLLLVHDEKRALTTLRALGVDTSEWESGVASLLYRDPRGPRLSAQTSLRARSPQRYSDTSSNHDMRSRRPSGASVHVVDVRQLYLTLRQISPVSDSVPTNARGLGVQLDPPKDKPDAASPQSAASSNSWWCAGTESLLLGKMWYVMARGPNIDDQRVLRWPLTQYTVAEAGPAARETPAAGDVAPAGGDDSEDGMDPNDIVPSASSTAPPASKMGGRKSNLHLMDPDGWDDASDDEW